MLTKVSLVIMLSSHINENIIFKHIKFDVKILLLSACHHHTVLTACTTTTTPNCLPNIYNI